MTQICFLMGSASDKSYLEPASKLAKELGISYRLDVASAHRTPAKVARVMSECDSEDVQVYICAAGHAAHLAGVVASKTIKPVVGLPIPSSALDGMDALLSTVMMPPGIPVATMALGESGGKNAVLFAAAIMALTDNVVAQSLEQFRAKQTAKVDAIETERG